ncbi:MAG: DUF3310 domain-containing protein [Bacilli bacterium]
MNHKELYINKKTFKVFEGCQPRGIDWIKIPEEAEECYYFDGSDPESVEDLCFYTKDLEATWSDEYWSDNTKCTSPTYQEIKNYVKEYGQLVWKRNVSNVVNNTIDGTVINTTDAVHSVADSVHHPKHYTSDDCGVEAIEITSLLPACISNAVKYVWRCGKKDEDLQELKKALWYINYSIDNGLPSFVNELSDSLEFQSLVEKVKSHWVGNKYMFIDAVYWGNQETMKKALKLMILELES